MASSGPAPRARLVAQAAERVAQRARVDAHVAPSRPAASSARPRAPCSSAGVVRARRRPTAMPAACGRVLDVRDRLAQRVRSRIRACSPRASARSAQPTTSASTPSTAAIAAARSTPRGGLDLRHQDRVGGSPRPPAVRRCPAGREPARAARRVAQPLGHALGVRRRAPPAARRRRPRRRRARRRGRRPRRRAAARGSRRPRSARRSRAAGRPGRRARRARGRSRRSRRLAVSSASPTSGRVTTVPTSRSSGRAAVLRKRSIRPRPVIQSLVHRSGTAPSCPSAERDIGPPRPLRSRRRRACRTRGGSARR